MDQLGHYKMAENYLKAAGRTSSLSDSLQSSERVTALAKLAEAHMKMIPLAPMAMPDRPL